MNTPQSATQARTTGTPLPAGSAASAARPGDDSLTDQWEQLVLALDAVLREARPGQSWLPRVQALRTRIGRLAVRHLNGSLYYLIYDAGHNTTLYSSHHAVLCMLVTGLTARMLGWSEDDVTSVECAALTMNATSRRLQDLLAANDTQPDGTMREAISNHAAHAAQLLVASGCVDKTWIEAVRLHHDDSLKERPLALLSSGQQAGRLLRRVDIFIAKMSRRASRQPMSPVQAAREACLGLNGMPDEIGAGLLKAVGLYPPGSFVELASGEVGVVVARGRKANLPVVAVLVNASGMPMNEPLLRDTVERRHAVKGAVPVREVKVVPPHDRLLRMRIEDEPPRP